MPDANMGTVSPSLPLPTLLSQALVAHTIELDNEAEHRLPHRTTRHEGRGRRARRTLAGLLRVVGQRAAVPRRRRRHGGGTPHPSAHGSTPPQRPPPVGVRHAHAAGGPAVAEATPGRRHRARPTSRPSGAGGLVPLPAIIDDRWRAPGRARLRPAGPGPQGRLRRSLHRSAGLPPGDPSHPGRQGRRAPST